MNNSKLNLLRMRLVENNATALLRECYLFSKEERTPEQLEAAVREIAEKLLEMAQDSLA